MDIINNRRSVRKYSTKKVEENKLIAILKAAMQAPSAVNQQPWEFIVVENEEKKDILSNTSNHTKFSANASAIVVVLLKSEGLKASEFAPQDLGASIQNLMLEAVNQGLGTTWMGVYPNQERVDYVRKALNVEERVSPFALIAVGYPENESSNKFIDRFDEKRIRFIK